MSDKRLCLGCLQQIPRGSFVCTECGLSAPQTPFWPPDANAAPVVGRAENLASAHLDDSLLSLLPKAVCERHVVLPLERTATSLTVAVANPFDKNAVDDLQFLTGLSVRIVVAPAGAIKDAIRERLGSRAR
jgi:hypothetical protein